MSRTTCLLLLALLSWQTCPASRLYVTLYESQLQALSTHWWEWSRNNWFTAHALPPVDTTMLMDSSVSMSDGHIQHIHIDRVQWTASDGDTVRLLLSGVNVTVTGSWTVKLNGQTHTGTVRSQITNASVDLWYIKLSVEQGFPYIDPNVGCSTTLKDDQVELDLASVEFSGVIMSLFMVGQLFGYSGISNLERAVHPMIVQQSRQLLCKETVGAIDAYMQHFVPELDLLVQPASDIYLDCRLDESPSTESSPLAVTFSSAADVYYNNNSVPAEDNNATLYSPPLSTRELSHLHYRLSVQESVLADLARALLHADRMTHLVTAESEPHMAAQLATSCDAGCLGEAFPRLAQTYPNSHVELLITSTNAPQIAVSASGIGLGLECTVDMHARLPSLRSKYVASLALIVRFETQARWHAQDAYFYMDNATTQTLTPTMKREHYSDEYRGNFTSHQISRFLNVFTAFVRDKMVAHVRVPMPWIRVPATATEATTKHTPQWLHVYV